MLQFTAYDAKKVGNLLRDVRPAHRTWDGTKQRWLLAEDALATVQALYGVACEAAAAKAAFV